MKQMFIRYMNIDWKNQQLQKDGKKGKFRKDPKKC